MLKQILFIVVIICILIGGVLSAKRLEKTNYRTHHWIWGIASFLVVLIPATISPHLNVFFQYITYAFCLYFGTIFFEQNRRKREAKRL